MHWFDDKELPQKKIKNNKIEKWTYEINSFFFFLTFKLLVNFSSGKKKKKLLRAIYYP